MRRSDDERGSAMVLAIFVLFLLAGMGVSLLFLSQTENRMSQADRRSKVVFFLAESGIEDGRTTLFNTNRNGPFSDDLVSAAGSNGTIDFDPDAIQIVYDANGDATAVSGHGDDVPVRGLTAAGDGWYAAFLTNDPIDGRTNTTDSNDRVLLTGIGASRDRSVEIAQAVIELRTIIPTPPPAAITLLGEQPDFESGNSNAKLYVGEDCNGAGVPNLHMPVVGTISSDAEDEAEDGVNKPGTFSSGPSYSGLDTVVDLTDAGDPLVAGSPLGTLDPSWNDCAFLLDMLDEARYSADHVCTGACTLPSPLPHQIVFVDGDLTLGPTDSNSGVLFVTGQLTLHGKTSWNGMIFVVGEGRFVRNGGGNGHLSGGIVIADVAGPDDTFGTDDDCTGGSGGFGQPYFNENGGGNGDTIYCTVDINNSDPVRPYRVTEFLQR